MHLKNPLHILVGLLASRRAIAASASIASFEIDLSPLRMLNLINETQLPDHDPYPGVRETLGIDLDVLKSLQQEWTTSFDWETEQAALNKYPQFTTIIEGITVHFIHKKSGDPEAIPLILNHGWPGSFIEFLPIIEPLTTVSTKSNSSVSFDVVIPSLPGFAFSSAPPANWTVDDTARIFNTLMTEVLGYETYAAHGTDWGAFVAYSMYDNFNMTNRAVHLLGVPFLPFGPADIAARNISLSPEEEFRNNYFLQFSATGNGYYSEQTTKPNTIGLALYDNPVGQLAWIGEKYIEWSDPRAGTLPSVLTHSVILLQVSLYFLTKSFVSSVFTYAQNANAIKLSYTKARTDAPMFYSSFKYNTVFWIEDLVSLVGNLVQYNYHDSGGHFAGLDNPSALVDDLRQIGAYWEDSSY